MELKSKITDISYIQGLKHLHTPEHIKYTHKISALYFTIHSVNKPFYHNNITNIYFTCSVMNLNKMYVRMHSNTTNKCEMNFFIKNKDFMTLDVSILPDKENKKNHYFIFKLIPNKDLLLFIPLFLHFSMFISILEDKFFFINENKKDIHHINFNKYRSLLFYKSYYICIDYNKK